jgi:hypothetical protein
MVAAETTLEVFALALKCEKSVSQVSDALWGLSYVTENPAIPEICVCKFPDICAKVVQLLTHHSLNICMPALRVIGNFSAASHSACVSVLEAVKHLPIFFRSPRRIKEALWILSNFLADSPQVTERVLALGILTDLGNLIPAAKAEARHEIAWCLANLIDYFQVVNFENANLFIQTFSVLAQLLHVSTGDLRVLPVALQALNKALGLAEIRGERSAALAAFGDVGVAAVEEIELHEDEEIYNAAVKIAEMLKFDS